MRADDVVHRHRVTDVCLYEGVLIAALAFDIANIRQVACVCEQVDIHDLVGGVPAKPEADEVGPDETGTAGDQKPHLAHYHSITSLIIGASGLVGGALLRALGPTAVGTYRSRPVEALRQLEVTNSDTLAQVLGEVEPDVVYFPAAEPNVDWCEMHPTEAHALNVIPAISTLAAAKAHRARFVFFSTDYVFDGERGPYVETDPVNPLSVYARHKRQVEERVLEAGETVIRTTTVFGRELAPGKNFVVRLVARIRAGETATIPADQVSTPTWADELAAATVKVAQLGGVWHVAGPDSLARDEFARLIADVFGLDRGLVTSVATSDLHQAARRPMLAGLRTDKLVRQTGVTFLPLRSALERFRDAS